MKDISKICLNVEKTGLDALRTIESGGCQIALITDKNSKLLGTISDGDIRRFLIHGNSLDEKVSTIMNKKFIFLEEGEKHKGFELMRRERINQIPILDSTGVILEILLLKDLIKIPNQLENPVIIMAGGIGSRLRPFTENCPKPMLKIGDKPIIEILLERIAESGFKNFFFSVNYLKEQIMNHFEDGSKWNVKINYLIEEKPLGTAGSLALLPRSINKPFIVINGDILTKFNINQLIEFHNKNNSIATICVRQHEIKVPYGVIESNGIEFKQILEKPTYRKYVNAGVYTFDPFVLECIDKNMQMDMPELIKKIKEMGKKVTVCPIHEYWIDIGRHETLKEADKTWLE